MKQSKDFYLLIYLTNGQFSKAFLKWFLKTLSISSFRNYCEFRVDKRKVTQLLMNKSLFFLIKHTIRHPFFCSLQNLRPAGKCKMKWVVVKFMATIPAKDIRQ